MNLYGKNQVIERFKANPKTIKKIYLIDGAEDAYIRELSGKHGISCIALSDKEFSVLAKNHHSQGIIAEVADFSYAELDDLLELKDGEEYTFLALSNITDPQNLGSILRNIACFGKFAVIIPKHRSADINETVLKVACGGENYVPVVKVTNLIPALEQIKKAGYWVGGCVVEGGEDITSYKLPFPLCIIIGSESEGIRRGVVSHLDFKLTLPMPGAKLSLNAAVAAAVFSYEIMRQMRAQSKANK
ncbi:MAG: 23S rRNA (guanosine(2251)-2'-O)-methyltransferase RlmB [Candidatus Omnitrophota bacterium]